MWSWGRTTVEAAQLLVTTKEPGMGYRSAALSLLDDIAARPHGRLTSGGGIYSLTMAFLPFLSSSKPAQAVPTPSLIQPSCSLCNYG